MCVFDLLEIKDVKVFFRWFFLRVWVMIIVVCINSFFFVIGLKIVFMGLVVLFKLGKLLNLVIFLFFVFRKYVFRIF